MAFSYSPLHLALPILLLHSNGDSTASIKQLLLLDSPLYLQAIRNISTLMAAKMGKISSECSRPMTGLSSGFSTILEQIQVHNIHIVLHEALIMVKKSL
jgi:hypothetical protein